MVPSGAGVDRMPRSQSSWSAVEIAVVPARHRRVERDEAQSAEIRDADDRLLRRIEPEQLGAQRRALVVVARDPDERCAELGGDGLDGRAQRAVGLGLAEIGQVAREDDGVGTDAEIRSTASRVFAQIRGGVEPAAERARCPRAGACR